MNNLKTKLFPFFIIIVIVCGFFWRVFAFKEVPLPGDFIVGVYFPWLDYKWGYPAGVPVKNPITTDVVSFTYPMQTLAMKLLKEGKWPLWNPYILAGSTLFANFQSAPFAPTRFVYAIFANITTAWSADVILQFILAAIFTYLLLRWWKLSKFASIFGGIVFAFSGYNLIFSEWNGHTLAAAFIPLALLFTDRFLKKQKYWDGAGLAIILALQFFSGYTQTSVYTGIAIGLLWFVRIIGEKKWFTKTFFLGFFCLIGIVLSSVQILPSIELINNSQRVFEPHPFEWTFLPWKKTITFVAPDYFGNHATYNYWGPQDYTSNTGYVGVVALVLSLLAIITLIKKREVKFLLIFAITALVLSFPDPISIFIWSKNIIGMQANSAHRATVLFCAAIAFLSAFGVDELMKRKQKLKNKIISLLPAYVLIGTFMLFAHFLFKNEIALKNSVLPSLILITLTIILFLPKKISGYLIFILMIFDLFRFGWKYQPISPNQFTYPTTPVLTFLQNQQKPFRTTGAKVIPSNLRMAYGIESAEGYDTFHPLNVSEFISLINSGNVDSLPVGRYGIVDNDISTLLDLINTKYYLALKTDENRFIDNPNRFRLVFNDKSVDIFESKTVLPRAFMVYDWQVDLSKNENDLSALNDISKKDFPLGKKIILEENPSFVKVSNLKNPINKVTYLKYDNQESVINVNTDHDGMLFVSDAYYPGWKAFVDGKETKIFKADFAFRAIEVPEGEHDIRMVYEPESFDAGLKISIATFVILVIIGGVIELWQRKY
ncbi:YfhO family protein [soil metagenome]